MHAPAGREIRLIVRAGTRVDTRSVLFPRPAQEPQGVGNDQQAGADVGGDGHPEVGHTEYGEDQYEDLGQKRDRDVLADARECRAAKADEPREPAEIVGQSLCMAIMPTEQGM